MSKNNLRIKEVIKEKGLSVESVAKKMGIQPSALSQSLNGNPTVEKLTQIAEAIGVPVTTFFESDSNTLICPNCGAKLKVMKED